MRHSTAAIPGGALSPIVTCSRMLITADLPSSRR
jgi:hypothetical protein